MRHDRRNGMLVEFLLVGIFVLVTGLALVEWIDSIF